MAVDLTLPFLYLRARRARGSLIVNGEDILAELNTEAVTDFGYSDNTSDKADDLKVTITDPSRTWMQRKLPAEGIKCEAIINVENWTSPRDDRPFRCGTFWINHVHLKGPPNIVSIRASSVPPNGAKSTKKNKAWESSNLRDIAGQIAEVNELVLFYDTQDNPLIKRVDQKDKTDLEFIRERAKENKLSMKIHDGKLIIYSEEEYESREPIYVFDYGLSNYLEYSFESKTDDIYESATNSHVNTETGKITETTFPDHNDPDDEANWSRISIPKSTKAKLRLNEDIEEEPDDPTMRNYAIPYADDENLWNDSAAANKGKGKGRQKKGKQKAKAKLREKNKKEHQSSIKTVGNPIFLSGLNVETLNFGIFDRKWFIESSNHEISSSGYTTNLKLRGCLTGY